MTDDELRVLIAKADAANWTTYAEIARDALRFRHLANRAMPYFDGFQLHMDDEKRGFRDAIDADMGEAP